MPRRASLLLGALSVVAALLAGCASTAPPLLQRPPEQLFHDARFGAPSEAVGAAGVFALSDSMRAYLNTEIAAQLRSKGRQRGLLDALYNRTQLKLEYDAAVTRNASQAFDARAGNCLSLVIMTAAFAKELGLKVSYQSAYTDETWSRSADLYLRSGHVNVTLGRRLFDIGRAGDEGLLTVDFLPPEDLRGLRTREIDEATILAMYMNNRAAEALVQGRLDDAYAWAREAIVQNPAFLSAYNTLGVIYLRHGDLAPAERAFGLVLEHEPRNTRAMFNLARTLAQAGRADEANALHRQLARLEPDPPFHYFNLGMAAMQRDDFRTARDLFAREVARAEHYHEFHYWLAVANFRLGDVEPARKHLALAMNHSTSRGEHDLYAAKLAWLKSVRKQQ